MCQKEDESDFKDPRGLITKNIVAIRVEMILWFAYRMPSDPSLPWNKPSLTRMLPLAWAYQSVSISRAAA